MTANYHGEVGEVGEMGAPQTDIGAAQTDIAAFLAHLTHQRRLSPHTIAAYRRDLAHLVAFINDSGDDAWHEITASEARAFAAKLNQAGMSAATIQRMLSAARAFFRYLVKTAGAPNNPFDGVSAPKAGRKLPAVLSVDEIAALLQPHDDDDILVLRDRAILELLYSSGLRLAELAALDCDGIDFAQAQVRVIGKGNKQRIVPVGAKARAVLRQWLAKRGALAASGENALFVNNAGARLGARGIQYRLTQFAKSRGLGRPLHPHMLRHSFAGHVLASSGDLRAVQEMLGHADIATTQIYTHLDFQHLSQVYDKAHPRARKAK